MEQNYSTQKLPGTGANTGPGYPPNASWSNPTRITADDGSSASIGFFEGGQDGDALVGSNFGFSFPPHAIIDGIEVYIDGTQTGCYGDMILSLTGTTFKSIGAFPQTLGSSTDLWGADSIDASDLASLTASLYLSDVSGGDGIASVDCFIVTVYWHIEIEPAPADVPIRVDYKVYTKDGEYLGLLPKVTSPFVFPQDLGSAGASIEINCGIKAENRLETEAIITGDGEDITTGTDDPLLATVGEILLARGLSDDNALFKNGNRVKIWMYNYWHPNGKLMFSGQINKVKPKYAGGRSYTKLLVLSDGLDMNNLVARGYPFNYTTDRSQTSQDGSVVSISYSGAGWDIYGQSFVPGSLATNLGAISLYLQGTANVTVSVYDAPNGNLIGSVTKAVANGAPAVVQFEFGQLIETTPGQTYFFAVWVSNGQSITIYRNSSSVYTDGSIYHSSYSGGSGGGSFVAEAGDLYFITKYGTPTTTATYSTQDPVTGMMSGIMTDYNNRGGYIQEGDFTAAGYTLTYTFNMAFITDALKKVLEMSPSGYAAYVDFGTSLLDIFPISDTADFTVVNDKDAIDVDIELSIEQVKNYLLLTGGDTGGGTNLYRDYRDSASDAAYGPRTATKADNRMTVTATADAVGDSFIDENSSEAENITLVVPVTAMDHSLLTPGKTIGFKNYGNFIDTIIQPIVRREFHTKYVMLTLGKMPIRMNDEVQRINRELLNEQTIANPNAPS